MNVEEPPIPHATYNDNSTVSDRRIHFQIGMWTIETSRDRDQIKIIIFIWENKNEKPFIKKEKFKTQKENDKKMLQGGDRQLTNSCMSELLLKTWCHIYFPKHYTKL